MIERIKSAVSRRAVKFKKELVKAAYGKCAVLLYHRVFDYETDPQLLCVRPENFDKQLKFLKANYHVLSIEEFDNCLLKKKKFPKGSILLTFDDGYADNYQYAMPILEANKMQALFYVCTSNIDKEDEFWWDALEQIILLSEGNKNYPISLSHEAIGEQVLHTSTDRKELYSQLLGPLKAMQPTKRTDLLAYLFVSLTAAAYRQTHRSVTINELKKFAASTAVVIGAHTNSHCSLAQMTVDFQKADIEKSKKLLEGWLGKKINYFSYPFGTKNDYSKDTIQINNELGFAWTSSNYPGVATGNTPIHEVPRHLVRDWSLDEFEQKVKGFFNS